MKNPWLVSFSLLVMFTVAPAWVLADEPAEEGGGSGVQAIAEDVADTSVDERLEDARRRLDEAAREVAELSAQRVKTSFRSARMHRGALGVVLAPGLTNGLVIAGVTPGGGAAKAGLVAGDVIVAINGTPVDTRERPGAMPKMLGVLDDVDPGDTVKVDYERDGVSASVDVVTQEHPPFAFAMGSTMALPEPPAIDFMEPMAPENAQFFARHVAGPPLMLHDVDEKLGRYFGVSEGVLVLTAHGDEQTLEPGDIVKTVAGNPVTKSSEVHHALMTASEGVAVEVLRNGGLVTVQVEPGTGGGPWTMDLPAREIRSVRVIRSTDDGEVTGVGDVNVDVIVNEQ